MSAFSIGLIIGLFIGGAIILCTMSIVIVGKSGDTYKTEEKPLPLWQFVEKYVAHNTLITLYREEYKNDDEPYFKAHPDVHKSKYINAPVVKVIGGRYEINSIDKIALVLGVKEAEE